MNSTLVGIGVVVAVAAAAAAIGLMLVPLTVETQMIPALERANVLLDCDAVLSYRSYDIDVYERACKLTRESQRATGFLVGGVGLLVGLGLAIIGLNEEGLEHA